MKRIRILITATAAAAGLALVPAAASAAATAGQPAASSSVVRVDARPGANAYAHVFSNLGGDYTINSGEFPDSFVNSSTVTKSLYLTNNNNLIDLNIAPDNSYYQTMVDIDNNYGDCATLDWANGGKTDKILDETCHSGEAAQEWDFLGGYGNGGGWVFGNEYMNSTNAARCANQAQPWVRGQTATAGLNIACPQSNGKPWASQVMYLDIG